MKVKFKRFSSRTHIPEKVTPGSVCFGVFSARCVTLELWVTRPIETDTGIKFPNKYVCRPYPHSGL